MKQILRTLVFCMVSMLTIGLSGCSDDDAVPVQGSYGFIKLQLYKQGTRGLLEGNELNKLQDAKKIELSLIYHQKNIKQTLNLYAVNENAAEYMLTSEHLKLLAGEYTITGYVIYGSYKEGNMAEILQVGTPDGEVRFTIQPDQLTIHALQLEAIRYGTFSATLAKQFPDMGTKKAATPNYAELFNYNNIDSVQMVLERKVNGTIYREDHRVKARRKADENYFRTDSITLQAGEYTLIHYELFNKSRQFMYAEDVEIPFTIDHFQLTEQTVDVKIPENEALRDYIALRQIWEAMDGEHWSWNGEGEPAKANWLFTFADGTPRPIDAWGKQPGVKLNNKGRVQILNLGQFNPLGVVPAAIGQLTDMEILYLGTHSEEFEGSTEEGMEGQTYSYSPYALAQAGIDIREHRLEIFKELTALRRKNNTDLYHSRLAYHQTLPEKYTYARPYAQSVGDAANRITGIDEAIGNLTNLSTLFIANAKLTKLPKNMEKLTNLTDLELFNLPLKELDGSMFARMNQLTAVNISSIYGMSESELLKSLDELCINCPKLQIMLINDNKLKRLPPNLYRIADLRVLDASFNKIDKLESILPIAPIQLMLDYNLLREIPSDFCKTEDIELFSATANQLQQFPAFLSNIDSDYTIEEIDLSANQMNGFQEGFKGIKVEQLKMPMNQMGKRRGETKVGEFPREFSDTKSEINYLVISGNNIDTIKNAALKNMKYLQAFDCSGNHLKYLPSGFNAENLPYLTGLELSNNEFRGFPNNVLNVNSINQLLMSSQGYFKDAAEKKWVRTMTEWPNYLFQHAALRIVDLSSNDFRTVTNFPTNLNQLNVMDNPNIQIVIPSIIMYRIRTGNFAFYFDEDQNITIGD